MDRFSLEFFQQFEAIESLTNSLSHPAAVTETAAGFLTFFFTS